MMELLKRFEESDAGEEADPGDEDEEEDILAQRLKGIDLGTSLPGLRPRPTYPTDVSVRFHVAG